MMEETRTCLMCNKTKPRKQFSENRKKCNQCRHALYNEASIRWVSNNRKKVNGYSRNYRYRNGHNPLERSKGTGPYLGVYIAERALGKLFTNITRMPPNNPGYDFICGKGLKIDAKSSCEQHHKTNQYGQEFAPNWAFAINKNVTPDYFVCLAFNNISDLEPMHVWLIPGEHINTNHTITITNTHRGLAKWSQYEQPLDKVIMCCNEMRETCKT